MRRLPLIAGAVLLSTLLPGTTPALASQIFIQQTGSVPAGGDPNLISDASAFNIGVAGNFTLQSPLLVIVAEYNGIGVPTIKSEFCGGFGICPAATIGQYGLTSDTAVFTASSIGSAFDQLGLASGGSENFGNFSAGDVALGLAAPTSFELYAFQIPASLTSVFPFIVGTTAVEGSYLLAYDCEIGTGGLNQPCATPGNVGQTVFTNTSLVDAVHTPEPTSLAIFGTAILGLGLLRRRRRAS